MTAGDARDVDQLNSFLRGELAAVETYAIALDHLKLESTARSRLDACLRSHEQRVEWLKERILHLGGRPAAGAGAWGAVTRAIEASASAFGDRAAIAALEQGEDHGLRDYKEDVVKLDERAKDLVLERLLPEQQQTHRVISDLNRELKAA
jgi:demethoxyubiquinone hydroxylase (CLK1/Coq7/Cat5 family)